jgi:hypothetical protein
LNEWEELGGCIAIEANHTKDKPLKKELDRLYARIRGLWKADEPPTTLKLYRAEDESEDNRP